MNNKKRERYTVFQGKNGKFYFNLKAANHEIILRSSDNYNSPKEATKVILWIKDNCQNPALFERKIAKNGEPYFVLKDNTGDTLGLSETYSSKQAMENGIESVQRNGITETILGIEDVYFEILINNRQFDLKTGTYKGAEILKLGSYIDPRFCLFLLKNGRREEIQQDQQVNVVGCLEFQVIRND